MYKEIGYKTGIAHSLFALARWIFDSQGDSARVGLLLDESLLLCRELGDKEGIAYCYSLAGQIAFRQGEAVEAHSLLEESVIIYKAMGDRLNTAKSLSLLARVDAYKRDHVAARALYEEGLALAREIGDKRNIASYLEGLAQVVALQGEQLWAARLWGAAEALCEATNTPLPAVDHADYERSVAAARTQLGEKAFAAAWSEGRTMPLEQILAARGTAEILALIPAEPSSAPPVRMPPTPPAGLTTREMDVLRLLAQGLTSMQMAERLVIGVVTINFHVRSIYSKLGVTSRAAATRYAMEHHLV